MGAACRKARASAPLQSWGGGKTPVNGSAGDLGAGIESQLAQDVVDVGLHRAHRDDQLVGNGAVALAPGDEGCHLALSRGQALIAFDIVFAITEGGALA